MKVHSGGGVAENGRSAIESSYLFHRELESFGAFCRRERVALLVFGLGFSLLMLAIIVFIDESFFYSRVQTDALMYYLKGRAFAETGSTVARLAVNLPPFVFPSAPGILRAPFMGLLSEFDNQLRGIQIANVIIMDIVAIMSAYILSWVVPQRWHWMAIAFSFGFTLISPWWVQNVFLPLTDAPYAALSVGSVLIAIRIITSPRAYRDEKLLILAFGIVFTGAFLMRFTEPTVLLLVAALIRGRESARRMSPMVLIGVLAIVVAAVSMLVVLNHETIFAKYFAEGATYARLGEKRSMFLNLVCLAIPQQIIPSFDLGFSRPLIVGFYHVEFFSTPGDTMLALFGFAISIVVFIGAWRGFRRFLPELLMVVAALPALVLLMPSTPRYLMTYQSFIWIWFYEGVLWIAALVPIKVTREARNLSLALAGLALVAGLGLGLKSRGFFNRSSSSVSFLGISDYIRGETETYRPLQRFLSTLPKDRAILLSANSTTGRWKAISDLDYYSPDSNAVNVATARDMYLVVDCGSADMCASLQLAEARMRTILGLYGTFGYERVFRVGAKRSRADVFRIRAIVDTATHGAETQKRTP